MPKTCDWCFTAPPTRKVRIRPGDYPECWKVFCVPCYTKYSPDAEFYSLTYIGPGTCYAGCRTRTKRVNSNFCRPCREKIEERMEDFPG